MTITNISWRVLAIFVGLVATTVDGWNNLSYVVNAGLTNDVIAAVATASLIMAVGLPTSIWGWCQGNYFSAICGISAFAIACSVSYGYSLNRMGDNRATEVHKIAKSNSGSMLSLRSLAQAEKKLEAAQDALASESVTGQGPKWKKAKVQEEQALAELEKAKQEVRAAGPMKHSETVEQTEYVVYALPLLLQLTSVAFFGIGFGRSKSHRDGGLGVQPDKPGQPDEPKNTRVHTQRVINNLKQSVQNTEHAQESVFKALQTLSIDGEFKTSYRDISALTKASDGYGVATGAMNEVLNSLSDKGLIERYSSKAKGTCGRVLNTEHAFA